MYYRAIYIQLTQVENILLSIFGTDGRNNNFVEVIIKVNKRLVSERAPIYLTGRIIAQARGRDTGLQ